MAIDPKKYQWERVREVRASDNARELWQDGRHIYRIVTGTKPHEICCPGLLTMQHGGWLVRLPVLSKPATAPGVATDRLSAVIP